MFTVPTSNKYGKVNGTTAARPPVIRSFYSSVCIYRIQPHCRDGIFNGTADDGTTDDGTTDDRTAYNRTTNGRAFCDAFLLSDKRPVCCGS